MKQWLLTIALTIIFLAGVAMFAEAETIYDLTGVFAPTLENQTSVSFIGQIAFPGDLSTEAVLTIGLDNEFDVITGERVWREAPLAMMSNMLAPVGLRVFAGVYEDQPVLLQWIDYDSGEAENFDATVLDGGGGWDAWAVSFADYQAGSIYEVRSVPEPGGLILALMGLLASAGGVCFRH